jgi:hypothetical protein
MLSLPLRIAALYQKKILINHFLIYQAYGKEEIKQECLFSLLSLRYHASEAFLEKLQDWRGSIDFVHRVKIKILQDAAQKYEGKFIYLDTDTYFLPKILRKIRGKKWEMPSIDWQQLLHSSRSK